MGLTRSSAYANALMAELEQIMRFQHTLCRLRNSQASTEKGESGGEITFQESPRAGPGLGIGGPQDGGGV